MTSYGIPRTDWHNPDSDPARVLDTAAHAANLPAYAIRRGVDEWGMRWAALTLNGQAFALFEHHEEFDRHDYAWVAAGQIITGTEAEARAAIAEWIESRR